MNSQGNKKPTYTKPVAICAGVLFFGSLLLSVLMATRDMAPPRKYEVDMSYVDSEDGNSNINNIPEPEPIEVPALPPPPIKEETGSNGTQPSDMKAPKIEPIE